MRLPIFFEPILRLYVSPKLLSGQLACINIKVPKRGVIQRETNDLRELIFVVLTHSQ
jgi:hypothetical protein